MPKTASSPSPVLKKTPGIKVTVIGQCALKGDRRTDLSRYEESFFLPRTAEKECLFFIRRFLIESRMEKKEAQFRFIRTCAVKKIYIAEDTGLAALEQKGVEEMDAEEIRSYVILKGWPVALLQDAAVDFDLIERVQSYQKDPKSLGKPGTTNAEEKDEDHPSIKKPLKEKWEELDK